MERQVCVAVKRLHRKKKAKSSFLRFYFGDSGCQTGPDYFNLNTEPEPGNHLHSLGSYAVHSRMRAWPEGLKKT